MNLIRSIRNNSFLSGLLFFYRNYFQTTRRKFGFIHETAFFRQPIQIKGVKNIYLYEGVIIQGHAKILTTQARFIMKKYSASAEGLTVVTGNHFSIPGKWWLSITDKEKEGKTIDKDVIVEEDVWLGANVTLLAGTNVGRGAIVGAGSVCRNKIPPYAIVIGNPARIIGYRFTPEEIILHEKSLYEEHERIPFKKLEKNYIRYFQSREKIADYLSFLK